MGYSMNIRIIVAACAVGLLAGCLGQFSTPEDRAAASQRADDLIRVAAEWRSESVALREQGDDKSADRLERAADAADTAAGVSRAIADEDPAQAAEGLIDTLSDTLPAPWGQLAGGVGALALAEWIRRQRQQAQLAGTIVQGVEKTGGPSDDLARALDSLMTPKQKQLVAQIKAKGKA